MKREVILITGQNGSGKTTTLRALYGQSVRGVAVTSGFSEDAFNGLEFHDLPGLLGWLDARGAFANKGTPFRVQYNPLSNEQDAMFHLGLELGNCQLFLEEADRFDYDYWYDYAVQRGRHHGVSIIANFNNLVLAEKQLRRQATTVLSFRQVEESDLGALAHYFGDLAFLLPNFPDHAALRWSPGQPVGVYYTPLYSGSPLKLPSEPDARPQISLDTRELPEQ